MNSSNSNRRTSLPAIFPSVSHNSNSLSPKFGFLKEISEFDIDPPFLSPASSSSSDNSPMLLSPTTRPASARLYRKQGHILPSNPKKTSLRMMQNVSQHPRDSYENDDNFDDDVDDDFGDDDDDDDDNVYNESATDNSVYSCDYNGIRKIPYGSVANKRLSCASPPLAFSLRNSPQNSPILSKSLLNRKLKRSGPMYSQSTESPRSLRSFNTVPEKSDYLNENVNEDESNNYDSNIEVQKLRELLKANSENKTDDDVKCRQQMRCFSVDPNGRVHDLGMRTSVAGGKLYKPTVPRDCKNRRATCPEIWLSAAEDERNEITKCFVKIFGSSTVGKKSVARQLFISADVSAIDDIDSIASEDLHRTPRTVSFMLNESELQLKILSNSRLDVERMRLATESQNDKFVDGKHTLYIVVYSIDNRDSFARAAKILYRLYEHRVKSSIPLILVANKIDLQRRRRVSTMEGKMLSKIYKCSFVEISASLSMNVDGLWQEILKKLYKSKQKRDQCLERGFVPSLNDEINGRHSSRRFVGRILNSTRRFAKSCEELVARIVAF